MKGIISAVSGVVLSFAALAVNASHIPGVTCATSDVTGDLGGSTDCRGPIPGNSPFPGDLTITGWGTFDAIAKFEVDGGALEGDDIGLQVLSGDGFNSGTWSFDPGLGFDSFVIVLKASDEFFAYLFDGAAAASFSGSWDVPSTHELSHLDVYAREDDSHEVFEPGMLGLFALGMPTLLLSRRRAGVNKN